VKRDSILQKERKKTTNGREGKREEGGRARYSSLSEQRTGGEDRHTLGGKGGGEDEGGYLYNSYRKPHCTTNSERERKKKEIKKGKEETRIFGDMERGKKGGRPRGTRCY